MSCYQYEYGSIKLPSAEFSRIRRAFANEHNVWLDNTFRKAELHYERLKAYVALNKKDKSVSVWSRDRVHGLVSRYIEDIMRYSSEAEYDKMMSVFLTYKTVDGKQKYTLVKPKKMHFKHVSLSNNEYKDQELSIDFDSTDKTIKWSVLENNRSVDRAWECPLGRMFSKVISSVEWTRATGGVFYYNDEYNREEEGFSGAGGDRVSHYFGPIGKKHQEDEFKSFKRRAR